MSDITIGRLRGGFCVIWREGEKRRRYQLKARNRKEAEAEAVDVYRRRTKPVAGDTVADCWVAYRGSLGDRPAGRTLDFIGKSILPFFGHYRPDQITEELCRSYAKRRHDEGRTVGTVHTELGHLRSALRYAEKIGMIDRAPHIWCPPKPEQDMRILNEGEMRALVEGADAPHIRLAIILLLGTACRVGALLELTWDRVDFDNNSINLRLPTSVTRKGRAVVPMSGMTRAALSTAAEAALSDYVIEYAMKPVKSIRTGFVAATRRAGLEGVTIHSLRHTAAVTMLRNGVPMSMIAQYLGHSNTSVTQRTYARFDPSSMQDAADVLDFMKVRKV